MSKKRVAAMLCALMSAAILTGTVEAVSVDAEKIIYLTFDDGPGVYTQQLLDVLKKHDVKATFFLVNTQVDMTHLLTRMVREGHSLGIHSDCHDFATVYASDDALMRDIYAMQARIFDLTGTRTWLLRFPGGSSNTVSRRYCAGIMSRAVERVQEEGFSYFDWNVDSGDAYGCQEAERIYRKIISGIRTRRRAVVLQHDVNGCSVSVVERVILWGKAEGYVFRALTQDAPPCRHRVQN